MTDRAARLDRLEAAIRRPPERTLGDLLPPDHPAWPLIAEFMAEHEAQEREAREHPFARPDPDGCLSDLAMEIHKLPPSPAMLAHQRAAEAERTRQAAQGRMAAAQW